MEMLFLLQRSKLKECDYRKSLPRSAFDEMIYIQGTDNIILFYFPAISNHFLDRIKSSQGKGCKYMGRTGEKTGRADKPHLNRTRTVTPPKGQDWKGWEKLDFPRHPPSNPKANSVGTGSQHP